MKGRPLPAPRAAFSMFLVLGALWGVGLLMKFDSDESYLDEPSEAELRADADFERGADIVLTGAVIASAWLILVALRWRLGRPAAALWVVAGVFARYLCRKR